MTVHTADLTRLDDPRGVAQILASLEQDVPTSAEGAPEPQRLSMYGASFEVHDAGDEQEPQVFSKNHRRYPRVPLQGKVRFGLDEGPRAGLVDINASGFSARIHPTAAERLPSYGWVEIDLGHARVCGYARLRRQYALGHHVVLGFELEPDRERSEIIRSILDRAYPAIMQRADLPAAAVARLLDESGYLELCEDGQLPDDWLGFRSPESFDLVSLGDDATPLAHLSITKAFSTTWVAHQLASRSKHHESFWSWYQLHRYLACMPAMMDGENAHVVAYYNPAQPYHQRYLRAFGSWMQSEADVSIAQYSMFHLDAASNDVGAASLVSGWSVTPLTSAARPDVHRVVLQNLSPLVARAFDLAPVTLESVNLTRDPYSLLNRKRRVFLLWHDGRVQAVALCERGASSVSIFGLFDLVQVLPTRDGFVAPQAALGMLMDAVRGFYRAEGAERALVFAPIGCMIAEAHPALEYSHVVERFIMGGRALRHYENFVRYTFGRAARAVGRKMKWKADHQ